jgi:hypothetical protein
MRLLHCKKSGECLSSLPNREESMGSAMDFFIELFSRPRPNNDPRNRGVLAILNAMSHRERREIRMPPPDFPRRARELALR